MRRSSLMACLGLTLLASAAHAQDNRWSQQASGGPAVTCESDDGRYRECNVPGGGQVVLTQQMSSSPCTEGRTWGSRGPGRVWVAGGCRAQFAAAYGGPPAPDYATPQQTGGGTVRCESDDGRQRRCSLGGYGRAVLVRQLSDAACVEGRTWGSFNGGVWVTGGCRGDFAVGGGGGGGYYPGNQGGGYYPGQGGNGYQIECASEGGRYTVCGWDRRAGRPALLEQLSSAECREGRSWGYNGSRLWVDRGCRGRFGSR